MGRPSVFTALLHQLENREVPSVRSERTASNWAGQTSLYDFCAIAMGEKKQALFQSRQAYPLNGGP